MEEKESDEDAADPKGEGEWRHREWSTPRRRSRSRWTHSEMTVLIAVMKRKCSYSKSLAVCRENGIRRGIVGIRRQWSFLRRKYEKIRAWEFTTGESYFQTSIWQRREYSLPLCFNRSFYDQLSSRHCNGFWNGRPGSFRRDHEEGRDWERAVPLAVLGPYEKPPPPPPPPLLLPKNERNAAAAAGDDAMELPGLVCDEAMDDNVAFADGCLRFEDDNVSNGFLMLEAGQCAIECGGGGGGGGGGDLSKNSTPRKMAEAARACLPRTVKEEVEELKLVEETARETLEASRLYQEQQQPMHIDRQRLELLMKADAAFLVAVNQLALAVQRLAEKLC